jgi:hypothetical protein
MLKIELSWQAAAVTSACLFGVTAAIRLRDWAGRGMADPARLNPARPDPARLNPARPDPARPDPARPDPARPGPASRRIAM